MSLSKLKKIAKKFDLSLVVLFGSRLYKKVRKDSDTDIAVQLFRRLKDKEMTELILELSKIFKDLDLVILNNAPPLLLAKIAESGKILYQRNKSDFANFQIRAVNEYIEFKPLLDLQTKLNKLKIKKLCRQ